MSIRYLTILVFVFFNLNASIKDYIFPYNDLSSYSNYSTLGIIQNPNSRFHEEGTLAFSLTHSDPYIKGSIVAYPFSWLEAAYHYTDINNALYSDVESFSGGQSYKDKGFDIKLLMIREGRFMPQIALGLRDFAGTDVFGAEFITMTKNVQNYDFTLGFGFGGLSANGISNPLKSIDKRFQSRAKADGDTQGGEPDFKKYFTGDMGIFAGFETILPNTKGIRFKVEYDGTNYNVEGFPFGAKSFKFAFEDVRQPQSKWNFGFVYPVNRFIHLNASFLKGNTFSIGFSASGFWKNKNPVVAKTDKHVPKSNSSEIKKITSTSDQQLYRGTLAEMKENELYVREANISDDRETYSIVYSQTKYNSFVRATGRAVQTLDEIIPSEVKTFELVNQNAGLNLNKVQVDRESFNKYKDENLYSLAVRDLEFLPAGFEEKDYSFQPFGDYPSTFVDIAPELRSQIGGPDGFFFGDLSLSLYSETKFARNIALSGHASVGLYNGFGDLKLSSDSVLPHVRTDIVKYLKNSNDYSIKRLQLDYFKQFSPNVYTKITGGILESMFAGIGGEVLYRPFYSNFALGAELWRVRQREYNMMFKFLDYQTTTGHINLYYREPRSQVLLTLRGGRFLAEDSGFNFDFSRRFPSGLIIGAFFSLTDVSEEEFGEGSFDKGFYFHVPIEIFSSSYREGHSSFGLRPLTRDGAQLIQHNLHLYGVTDQGSFINFSNDFDDLYE